jgi:RHS repeat-associated protein
VTENTGAEGEATYVRELWNGGDHFTTLGVVQLGARFYDPAFGRFLQRDPLTSTLSPGRANPYAFAFNDPVNFVDPSGLQPETPPTGTPPFDANWSGSGNPFSFCWFGVCASTGSSAPSAAVVHRPVTDAGLYQGVPGRAHEAPDRDSAGLRLFGQTWVWPWDPDAAGALETLEAYGDAAEVGAAGALAGMASGGPTGAAVGAGVGSLAGGVGAAPGAALGFTGGVTAGFFAGLTSAAFADTLRTLLRLR